MGHSLTVANRMNLAAMTPRTELASTKYCLANPDEEYLVYLPDGGNVTVDLTAVSGSLLVEWLDPQTGETMNAGSTRGGERRELSAPFRGDAVLYLVRSESKSPT